MKSILKKNLQFLIALILMVFCVPTTSNAYNIVAKQGNTGEQVEQIQAMLSEVGLYYGNYDYGGHGIFRLRSWL